MQYGGIEYAMVVFGLVSMETRIAPLIPRWLTFGGDASYSLYLIHPMVGVLIAIAVAKLHVHSAWLGLGTIALASLLAAAGTYLWIERPVMRYLRSKARLSADLGRSLVGTGMGEVNPRAS
jgi:peptidoglycan/LPS O-acetylase OafA/YrhL